MSRTYAVVAARAGHVDGFWRMPQLFGHEVFILHLRRRHALLVLQRSDRVTDRLRALQHRRAAGGLHTLPSPAILACNSRSSMPSPEFITCSTFLCPQAHPQAQRAQSAVIMSLLRAELARPGVRSAQPPNCPARVVSQRGMRPRVPDISAAPARQIGRQACSVWRPTRAVRPRERAACHARKSAACPDVLVRFHLMLRPGRRPSAGQHRVLAGDAHGQLCKGHTVRRAIRLRHCARRGCAAVAWPARKVALSPRGRPQSRDSP